MILQQECWIPFSIQTLVVGPKGGTFDLVPPVTGVVEEDADKIRLEVEPSNTTTTFSYAVLIEGPFQLPIGYRFASHVVYIFSDPSQPTRPYRLYLPHWCNQEIWQSGGLSFAEAPHTHSEQQGRLIYSFQLKQGGQFMYATYGSLLVNGHSTLYVLIMKAYRQDTMRKCCELRYSVTHLVSKLEDASGVEVSLVISYASAVWKKVCICVHAGIIILLCVRWNTDISSASSLGVFLHILILATPQQFCSTF